MLLYHPAFDLNHANYRIMLLLRALSPEYVEPDKLRILDFFFLFPAEIHSIRQPDKKFKTAFQSYAHYEEMTNPSKVFYQIEPIFSSALSLMKSRGVVVNKASRFADEFIGLDYEKVPAEIKERIESAISENAQLIEFLSKTLSKYPLRGADGLKDRTKLLPFKNDRK